MVQNGDAAKPIWITEVGWIVEPPPSCYDYAGWSGWWWQRVSLQTQADYLVRAFRYAHTYWPWMDVMFVWNMDYNLVPWNEFCDPKGWFAVLNHDSTPRQAYWDLASLVHNGATPTPMPTASSTPTPLPTPTRTPNYGTGTGTIEGNVQLQGRTDHSGAAVSAGGETTLSAVDGSFRIEGVAAGAQRVDAAMAGYLRSQLPGLLVYEGQVTLAPTLQLLAGDINGDGVVNLFDLVAVSSRYGMQGPAYAEDINGDHEVNLFDLVLVSANYDARSTNSE
jgi:hypothetical protein